MKTLIVYATKYGATTDCAARIAAKLPGETQLCNLSAGETPALSSCDAVIVGTSVYIGRPRKEIAKFLKANQKQLLEKPLGLFLCCVQDVNKSLSEQVNVAFPAALREHARVIGALGGVVNFSALKGFDKLLMNLISGDIRKKTGASVVNTISSARIDQFIAAFTQASA